MCENECTTNVIPHETENAKDNREKAQMA